MTNVFVVLILEFNNVRGENLKRFSMPDSKKKKERHRKKNDGGKST